MHTSKEVAAHVRALDPGLAVGTAELFARKTRHLPREIMACTTREDLWTLAERSLLRAAVEAHVQGLFPDWSARRVAKFERRTVLSPGKILGFETVEQLHTVYMQELERGCFTDLYREAVRECGHRYFDLNSRDLREWAANCDR